MTNGAGLSLRWKPGRHLRTGVSYDELAAAATAIAVGSDGLLWAPYLFGERTPHLDPLARAAFVGLTASHTRAHCTRAVMEGVAMSLRDLLSLRRPEDPGRLHPLEAAAHASPLWQQIQADVYGHPVELLAAEEGGAFGAALLAAVGIGEWPTVEAACSATVHVARQVDPKDAEAMDRAYARFRRLYPAMKSIGDA